MQTAGSTSELECILKQANRISAPTRIAQYSVEIKHENDTARAKKAQYISVLLLIIFFLVFFRSFHELTL